MNVRAEDSLPLSRARRWFPELASARALAAELRENPYWARWHLRGGAEARRRAAALAGLAALAAFGLGQFLALRFAPLSAAGFILLCAAPARLYLVARAAARAAAIARREMQSDAFVHLYLTPLAPRDYILAWSASAWARTLPETAVLYALLAPFAAGAGLGLLELFALEALQVVLLEGLAAAFAARGALEYSHRRDAAWAAWIMASFSCPLLFFAQSLVFLPIVAALPFAFGMLAEAQSLLPLAAPAVWAGYALWFPFAWLQAMTRQFGAEAPHPEDLRAYLDAPRARPRIP